MDSSCFAILQCIQPLKALCTTSHLRLHTHVHTVMNSLQGTTFPWRDTRGWLGWRMVGEVSPLKVHWGANHPVAPALWPLASWLTCPETTDKKCMDVMLFHAAWCRPTQLCLSQVEAEWAHIDHRVHFPVLIEDLGIHYSRNLSTIDTLSVFSDSEKFHWSDDDSLYMHFKA